ncbi:MAG TPA: YdcF family protein [Streptosporangiaceae bacterium]
MPSAADLDDARRLWDYLRLGIQVRPAECLLVFGGHDIGVATRAADLYADGTGPLIVVSGGSRAVPDGSDSPTEADAIAEVLLGRGVPKEAIALERLASNTSENFWLSAELLRDLGLDPQTFVVVTKPSAERRTLATARRRWPHRHVAVTSQQADFDDYLAGGIPADRVLSHLAGEALRLEAYAATGLIDPGEPVPANILSCARTLQNAGFNGRAVPQPG